MNILFIHTNYPSQFKHLAAAFGRQAEHDVRFLTARKDAWQQPLDGVKIELFEDVEENTAGLLPMTVPTDQALRRGLAVQAKVIAMAKDGFVPRLIIFHGGNGLGLTLKDLVGDCAAIGYFEWYFQPSNTEAILGNRSVRARNIVALRNLVINHELLHCDMAVTPTQWQANQFPNELKGKINVAFDGIETQFFAPAPQGSRRKQVVIEGEANHITLNENDLLLSYATRGMEPIRGFPEFMRALPIVLAELPQLKVLIGGRDRCAYSYRATSHNGSWKEMLLEELGPFPGRDRVIFTGLLNYGQYRQLLYRTNLHCYFSREYVTSWSLFEAVACQTPVLTNIGEATTGTLPELACGAIDLNGNPEQLAAAIIHRLSTQAKNYPISLAHALTKEACLQQWQAIINQTLSQTRNKAGSQD